MAGDGVARKTARSEPLTMTQKHRVVILGGGFAGLNAAQKLARVPVEVTLIDRRNFHLFQPLLYQVATGSLSPGEICAPLRGVLSKQKNVLVLMGEAMDIDPDAKRVKLRDGGSFDYDSLIVSTGSKTSYYGNDAWREYAPSLKTIEEATAIRHKLLYAFERAERCASETDVREWLTFVIVGAGATGLELAGALAEIANETLKNDFRRINPKDARIILMEGGNRVLAAYPPDLSEKAEKLVKRLGVEVMKGVMATAVDAEGVTYKRGDAIEKLRARTVLWTGGVIANTFGQKLAERTKAETDRSGRIKVQPDLTIPNYPDIFVVGDLAAASAKDGKPLPGVAQVAIRLAHLAIHSPLVHRGISRSRAGLYPVGIRVFDLQPRRSLNHRGGRWDSRDKAQRVTQILADFPSATQSPVLPTNRLSPII